MSFQNQTIHGDRIYSVIDGENILLPRRIPKLSWREKEALLIANGVNKTEIAERRQRKRQRVSRKISKSLHIFHLKISHF